MECAANETDTHALAGEYNNSLFKYLHNWDTYPILQFLFKYIYNIY